MSTEHVEQHSSQVDVARRRLRARLDGLTDEEYLWEPVPGCWNVRRAGEAVSPNAMGYGGWVFDYDHGQPSPAPFTTIGWRLMHLTDVIGSYHSQLYGDRTVADDWLEVTPEAGAAIALWDEHAGRFADALAADTDERLDEIIRVPWWTAEAPRWRVVANVAIEMHHHGAEIGVLRDLYARRSAA